MTSNSGDDRRSAATDCYLHSSKTFSSAQEMLDDMDPEFGEEFRSHSKRPTVWLRKWWCLFRIRWRMRRDRLVCWMFGHRHAIQHVDNDLKVTGVGNCLRCDR